MKNKTKNYYCRYCGCEEVLPEPYMDVGEVRIIERPLCPICLAKGKYRKMLEVTHENTKKT